MPAAIPILIGALVSAGTTAYSAVTAPSSPDPNQIAQQQQQAALTQQRKDALASAESTQKQNTAAILSNLPNAQAEAGEGLSGNSLLQLAEANAGVFGDPGAASSALAQFLGMRGEGSSGGTAPESSTSGSLMRRVANMFMGGEESGGGNAQPALGFSGGYV